MQIHRKDIPPYSDAIRAWDARLANEHLGGHPIDACVKVDGAVRKVYREPVPPKDSTKR